MRELFENILTQEFSYDLSKYNDEGKEKVKSVVDKIVKVVIKEMLSYKKFISDTPLAELEYYSDETNI